jgi:hypothetical protein
MIARAKLIALTIGIGLTLNNAQLQIHAQQITNIAID